MIKIAIPVFNNLLSEYFDEYSHFELFEINEKQIIIEHYKTKPISSIKKLSQWINKSGVTDVIAHKMNLEIKEYFSGTKINLYLGVSIKTPQTIVNEYLTGTLKSNL